MKQKNNGGFSLIEVLVAMTLLAAIVIPVCSSLVLSARINAKADAVLQARLAVSSAVESLMAAGITQESETYDELGGSDRFPDVRVVTRPDENGSSLYYIVEVTDNNDLVTVTTCIHAAGSGTAQEGAAE